MYSLKIKNRNTMKKYYHKRTQSITTLKNQNKYSGNGERDMRYEDLINSVLVPFALEFLTTNFCPFIVLVVGVLLGVF